MSRDPSTPRPTTVNFLPDWYLQRRRGQRLLLCQGLMLVGVLLLFGWLIARELHRTSNLAHRHTELRETVETARSSDRDLDELRTTHRELVRSLRGKRRLHRPVGYAEIAATLVNLIPESVSLRYLRMEINRQGISPGTRGNQQGPEGGEDEAGPERTERSVVTLRIEGIGPSDTEVSRFTGALASNPLFHDVEIGYWRQATHDGLRVRRFEVRTTVPLDRRYQPPAEPTEPTEVTDAG